MSYPRLDQEEQQLVRELGIKLYIFLAYSTELWDQYSSKELKLRNGQRLLHGGLQLGTKHMPQGPMLTIPMTSNIGLQNQAHVLIHFENAEPDLGRKGFQPDQVHVAEKISVSAVTAFRNKYELLRKPGATKDFGAELKIASWIETQQQHEAKCPLKISGKGLFLPTEELPIRSEALVEQDVVALFNQMLSSGIVRGLQLISSSQFKQYDGLYRIKMEAPYDKYFYSEENPLGVARQTFDASSGTETLVKVLEYKFTVNGLIEELQSDLKSTEDIGLVVAWEMGDKWKNMFTCVSYLDPDNIHHRKFHGTTHNFTHSLSGSHAFEVIILKDLVNFLHDPLAEGKRQRTVYSEDSED